MLYASKWPEQMSRTMRLSKTVTVIRIPTKISTCPTKATAAKVLHVQVRQVPSVTQMLSPLVWKKCGPTSLRVVPESSFPVFQWYSG
mmetsp:Transcript_7931/g.11946  ORF Transcript_7931/g.11946 Transcript_7931/m.11946 type:complete len:87 (+) Transcript_7931:207-467(+)